MSGGETARTVISDARVLLDHHIGATEFVWPRAAAVLGRQAIELSLDVLWRARAPGLQECSARAQLICLPTLLEPELAGSVDYVYSALSNACHHHPYELSPARSELISWLAICEQLATAVDRWS